MNQDHQKRTLDHVSAEDWEKFSRRRIFFGHQSVGQNIAAGIAEIASSRPELGLRLVEGTAPEELSTPGLLHARIGENRDPRSKSAALRDLVAGALGDRLDVAAVKYCYVDVTKETDVEELFAAYKAAVERIHLARPDVKLVHMTLPLEVSPISLKTRLKLLLGRGELWEIEDNVARNRFNRKLLAEYTGREPVFDLARVEATRPDETLEVFEAFGETHFALVPEYTDDGGHLNEVGRRFVAEQLLVFLAELD